MYSIILVSRNREKMLGDMIESIFDTSYFKHDNEIIIGCDTCAEEKYAKLINKYAYQNVNFVFSKRTANLHSKINRIARLARNNLFLVLNDDCVLTNQHWDLPSNLKFNDKIMYGVTHDDSIDRVSSDYAAFPVISRKGFEKLGFLMDETYGNHGSDVVTYRIYKDANAVVDLPEIKISHVLHNSVEALKTRMNNDTATDMINRTMSAGFNVYDLFNMNISSKSSKLKD